MPDSRTGPDARPRGWSLRGSDVSLSVLLAVQAVTTFIAVPLSATSAAGRSLMDVSQLVLVAVCAVALTRHGAVRAALLASVVILGAGPAIPDYLAARMGLGAETPHVAIALVAFAFIALVTLLVARRAFGPGRVTGHRVQGAVVVYLNVAVLCAITFELLEAAAPGAIRTSGGQLLSSAPGARTAELSYFSLSTITTVGYGDLVPVHPMARSLASLESVFGQLFPATFLARLVALRLSHRTSTGPDTEA